MFYMTQQKSQRIERIPTGNVLWIVFAHVQFQAIDTVTNGQKKAPIILLNLNAKLIHYSNSVDL